MSMDSEYVKLFENCVSILSFDQKESFKKKLKKLVKRLIGRKQKKIEYAKWSYGLIASAVYYAGKKNPELKEKSTACLHSYFEKFAFSENPAEFVHDLLAFEVLIDLYEDEIDSLKKEKYLLTLKKVADFIVSYERDSMDNILYVAGLQEKFIFADTLGVCCPFLFRMGKILDDKKLCLLAEKQITNFLKKGMDETSGLPYHGFVANSNMCYGIIGWGRAVGWVLRGMSKMIASGCSNSDVLDGFKKLLSITFDYQKKDGLFSWQISCVKGPSDTSASAMIFLSVLDSGISGFEDKISCGISGLKNYLSAGNVSGSSCECGGFSVYPQKYGSFLWSTGPGLEVLSKDGE